MCSTCGASYSCGVCQAPFATDGAVFSSGQLVQVKIQENTLAGKITGVNADGTYEIRYEIGLSEHRVKGGLVQALPSCASLHSRTNTCRTCSEPRALLQRRLASPSAQLKADDSLRLVTACVSLGASNAQQVCGQKAVMVVGNTG